MVSANGSLGAECVGQSRPGTKRALRKVCVSNVADEAENIRSYELTPMGGGLLPDFDPGAHIIVNLPSGLARQYSLTNSADERWRYVVAVQKENEGRGGSKWLYENLREGSTLEILGPANHFPLVEDAKEYLLIAGGIGITPILSMVRRLHSRGAKFTLVYCAQRPSRAAFREILSTSSFAKHVDFVFSEDRAQGLDLASLLEKQSSDVHAYCCGPSRMIGAFRQATRNWAAERVHLELFTAHPEVDAASENDQAFLVEVSSTGERFEVPPGESILSVLSRHGIEVPRLCESGYCGSCLTGVLDGSPDHRDSVQSDAEKASDTYITPCCSRAKSELLVLDL